MSKIENLGWEQLVALRVIRDTLNMEGSAICKAADCSFAELFTLAQEGLIDLGEERLEPKRLHPTLTSEGLVVLKEAEERGIL
jgi:hypothetical protein